MVSTSKQRFFLRHRHRHFLFGQLRNPEVEHFHVPVRPQHDVLRLDVAMDNAGFVGGRERSRDLDRHVDRFICFHRRARQTLAQRLAVDQFTGNVVSRMIFADLVNGQDVWMIERNDRARFLFETASDAPHRR